MTATASEERQNGADGGTTERTAASYAVPHAAELLGIPIRTLRDWIQSGKLRTVDPTPPQRGRRIPFDELERLRRAAAEDGGNGRHPEADGGGPAREAAPESERRQWAAPPEEPAEVRALRAELRAVERERETLAEMVDHLRAQVDRRTQAEEELRKLLAMAQHAITLAIDRPALPAAPITQAPAPKRTRWWKPWSR